MDAATRELVSSAPDSVANKAVCFDSPNGYFSEATTRRDDTEFREKTLALCRR